MNIERLYALLPTLYRQRDAQVGEPLRALLKVLEAEAWRLQGDIEAMYDNWFIATCDRWTIPFLAELVGVDNLRDVRQLVIGQRRRVANTIGYRRRKGTTAVLENAARDVTGWPVRVVEYWQWLATAQHLGHLRPGQGGTVAISRHHPDRALPTTGPSAHIADIRQGAISHFNPQKLGLFIWRLQTYPMTNSPVCPVADEAAHYWLDARGMPAQLFNHPHPPHRWQQRSGLEQLPLPLTNFLFAVDLARTEALTTQLPLPPQNSQFYGPARGLHIAVWQNVQGADELVPVPPQQVASVDFRSTSLPTLLAEATEARKWVAIDVEQGRFAFLREPPARPQDVVVTYTYGFSDEIGGGPYERWHSVTLPENARHVTVAKGSRYPTIGAALAGWDVTKHKECHVEIRDNGAYDEGALKVPLPEGTGLHISAADGVRPVVKMTLTCTIADAPTTDILQPEMPVAAHLNLNGLLIEGQLVVTADNASGGCLVEIGHTTFVPTAAPSVQITQAENVTEPLRFLLDHSIVGPVCITGQSTITIRHSIVDGDQAMAIDADGGVLTIEHATVFGQTQALAVQLAINSIFTAQVTVGDARQGEMRFSYVPSGSVVPRQDHCQPSLSLLSPARAIPTRGSVKDLARRIRPHFTSTTYGSPGYAQLGQHCPPEIGQGSNAGSEMGVFHDLYQPQRSANLQPILDEYVPLGLIAGVIYQT